MKSFRYILHSLNLASYPEFCNCAPVVEKTKRERKQKAETGEVGTHGKRTTVTDDNLQQDSGTVEWKDTTATIGKDDTRSAQYSEIDDMVLSMDKYLKLDETKYRILKQVWAANVSAEKAGDDYRVKNLEGVALTIRKLYWAAFNQAHTMKQKRGEAMV
jgi:membrane protein implicated in regulation of membrane protease activity